MDILITPLCDRPLFSPDFIILFENFGVGRQNVLDIHQAKYSATLYKYLKVDHEDHFWHPGFLPSYYNMCFPRVQSLKFR